MKPSKSPDRGTFQRNAYIARCESEGEEPREDYLKLYEENPELEKTWAEKLEHENDMEWDLRTTDWILEKVRTNNIYAQHLYAAMCNNEFQRKEVFPILANQTWCCSWRYAGGIIADMQQKGDYIDWYCSGIRGDADMDDESYNALTKEEQEHYIQLKQYVPESVVTDEIRADLGKLGWTVLEDNSEE